MLNLSASAWQRPHKGKQPLWMGCLCAIVGCAVQRAAPTAKSSSAKPKPPKKSKSKHSKKLCSCGKDCKKETSKPTTRCDGCHVWSHTECAFERLISLPDFWICPTCAESGLVPYYDGQKVEKKRGGGRGKSVFIKVLAPPTEEEEKSFGTKGDVRKIGNYSAL